MTKKVAVHMLGLQDVEDLRRPFRIGPVVEGQRQLLGHLADAANDVIGRQALIMSRPRCRRVSIVEAAAARKPGADRLPPAGFRLRCRQRSTLSLCAGCIQRCRRGQIIAPAHQRQHGRILGAQPPQRIARRLIVIGGMDLVEGGDGIQEPDIVPGAVAFRDRRNADCWWRRRIERWRRRHARRPSRRESPA